MKRSLSYFLALAALCVTAFASPADAPSSNARRDAEPAGADSKAARRLVWSDEFNGCALDPAKWQFWGTMFSTDNVYTNDARTTVRVAGGLLRLRIHADPNPFVLVVR